MSDEVQPYNDLDPSASATETTTPPPSPRPDDLDRNSAIALGSITCILLALILWFFHTRLKRRRQLQALTADIERRSSSIPSSTPNSILSRHSQSTLGRNSLSTTGSRYSDSRSEGRWGLLDQNIARLEEKRWWGSVAACGDAKKADKIVGTTGRQPQQQQGTEIGMKMVDGRALCPHCGDGWMHVNWMKRKSGANDSRQTDVQEVEPAITRKEAWGSDIVERPRRSNGVDSRWENDLYTTNGVDRRDWVGTLTWN
ncbi:hypothetical protein K491DRAFT_403193 [Lophiostoma macrostomum CBS 122681]|uniref:Uncharacterized protein n=1 Tax=Lophiostoma macrostomum CBS 122681 TaxID=1314788 RepID=A0A6A6T859_9PLEO|nr:hypothetical protein K491DRAFT_403193 [Lophiostoma macrostomum CBS 122681]